MRCSNAQNAEMDASAHLKNKILEQTGASLPVTTDAYVGGIVSNKIFVGRLELDFVKPLWQNLGENDYRVLVKQGNVYIIGGSDIATYYAYLYFVDNFLKDTNSSLTVTEGYEYVFKGAESREHYVQDPSLLLMNWINEFQPPEGMLDFNEKQRALDDSDGRLMSSAHRGNNSHYPENSIEAIISAVMMGCDICEIDVRLTADGIPVLFHDASLAKKTNFNSIKGTVINGITMPTSDDIADWTLEQIGYLRYTNIGGKKYKIATLEEAVKVAKGRIFLLCEAKASSLTNDILPIFAKHNIIDQLIGFGNLEEAIKLKEASLKAYPSAPLPKCLVSAKANNPDYWVTVAQTLDNNSMTKIAVAKGFTELYEELGYDGYVEQYGEKIANAKGKTRLLVYIAPDGDWSKLATLGYNLITTDSALDCCKYIAQTYFS